MKKIKERIKKYLTERGWNNLKPSDIAKSVAIESGELLELFQWENKTLKEVKNDEELVKRIEKELADVFIYCLDMSVLLDIDPQKIIFDKLDHIDKKYPAEVMKNRQDKESEGSSEYWRIKREYRRNENDN